MKTNLWWCWLLLVGCAGSKTPGSDPHDMSVAGHEAMAAQEDRNAAGHSQKFDPNAATAKERCSVRSPTGAIDGACWTSVTNPTAEHLEHAKQHQKMAADHRAASAALRDAEAKACVGISALDRDMSPFAHTEDISSVGPLYSTPISSKGAQFSRPVGAVVTFRALPGMTAQWLQRTIDCHIARNAALGHQVPEMPYCPLVPNGVTATVKPTQDGFAVEIRSEDDVDVAREISRRADLLTKR